MFLLCPVAHGPILKCAICSFVVIGLFGITIRQALFISPCSHTFHYKCIRPILEQHRPAFSCPLCRTYADLEEDVEVDGEQYEFEEGDENDSAVEEVLRVEVAEKDSKEQVRLGGGAASSSMALAPIASTSAFPAASSSSSIDQPGTSSGSHAVPTTAVTSNTVSHNPFLALISNGNEPETEVEADGLGSLENGHGSNGNVNNSRVRRASPRMDIEMNGLTQDPGLAEQHQHQQSDELDANRVIRNAIPHVIGSSSQFGHQQFNQREEASTMVHSGLIAAAGIGDSPLSASDPISFSFGGAGDGSNEYMQVDSEGQMGAVTAPPLSNYHRHQFDQGSGISMVVDDCTGRGGMLSTDLGGLGGTKRKR